MFHCKAHRDAITHFNTDSENPEIDYWHRNEANIASSFYFSRGRARENNKRPSSKSYILVNVTNILYNSSVNQYK